MRPRIRSSVGVVINDEYTEFFKGNTRRSILLKMDKKVAKLLCTLDGTRTIDEICIEYSMNENAKSRFIGLIDYLIEKCIVFDQECRLENEDRKTFSRVFSMIEDYTCDEYEIQKAWGNIRNSTVCIVGVGAVGSWIAANLIQSGVKNLILIDGDLVEESNLHRQWGYIFSDVGKSKLSCLSSRLKEMNEEINIQEISEFIDKDSLERLDLKGIDLIIDCADKPTVDQTAIWIGEFCMKRAIPHIIAGGYNLHVSLIGQTIIPFHTACVKCFEKQLKEHNDLEIQNMKKLATPGRKIGSIGPMCSLSASFSSIEAIKVLSKIIPPSNINRRGEFNIYNMDIQYHSYSRLDDCEWCGKNGRYAYKRNISS